MTIETKRNIGDKMYKLTVTAESHILAEDIARKQYDVIEVVKCTPISKVYEVVIIARDQRRTDK